jgi:hypothetical protein
LLASSGIKHNAVGRYLMNHPKGVIGKLVTQEDFSRYFGVQKQFHSEFIGLRFSEKEQEKRGVLNSYLRLTPQYVWSGNAGVEAFIWLFKQTKISLTRFVRQMKLYDYAETGDWTRDFYYERSLYAFTRALFLISINFVTVLRYVGHRLTHWKPKISHIQIRGFLEMAPHPENKIILSQKKNSVGILIPQVMHKNRELEKKSIECLYTAFRDECIKRGIGKVTDGVFDDLENDVSHHMGGTRMGVDENRSVVDSNLKIHQTRNVFIAGSSVFPTGGCANPTLTIVALSIRLADFLKQYLSLSQKSNTVPIAESSHSVIIIGSGRRVRDDVLPVLLSLPRLFSLYKIYARSEKVIRHDSSFFNVESLEKLTADDIQKTTMIYIAVPERELSRVLAIIEEFDLRTITLIVDTPAPRRLNETRYRRVYVAEDSVFLPWLEFFERKSLVVKKIIAEHSMYRYHGVAICRVLGRGLVRFAFSFRKSFWLWCGTLSAHIIEPRDYQRGHLTIKTNDHTFSDVPRKGCACIHLVRDDEHCVGFTALDMSISLSKEESALIGRIDHSDTIVTKMLSIKRVGLRRLLQKIALDDSGWTLKDGQHDARVDRSIFRLRGYVRF